MLRIKSAIFPDSSNDHPEPLPKDFTDISVRRLEGKLQEMQWNITEALQTLKQLQTTNPRINFKEASEMIKPYLLSLGITEDKFIDFY